MDKKNQALLTASLVALCALGGWTSAWAEGGQGNKENKEELREVADLSRFLITDEELNTVRAREGGQVFDQMNESDQRAWLEQNRLQSTMTGDNVIHEAAMRIEGIGSVIQNTGNQVIIQDTMQINLTITP